MHTRPLLSELQHLKRNHGIRIDAHEILECGHEERVGPCYVVGGHEMGFGQRAAIIANDAAIDIRNTNVVVTLKFKGHSAKDAMIERRFESDHPHDLYETGGAKGHSLGGR